MIDDDDNKNINFKKLHIDRSFIAQIHGIQKRIESNFYQIDTM